ncbi:alpha/beta hydrolase family protein [Flavobacterium sp. RNTU_13]|uniref:alpha/beta hydrolase family protein n=1 Tax=Flavobacterium sp. RNTU_13 TaxID=3375145 RepID=UPI0039887205
MKKLLLTALLCLTAAVNAQDATGDWFGLLSIPGTKLHINLHIKKADKGYTATMDSPDQGANGLPVTTITIENNTLNFSIPSGGISYKGTVEGKSIKGTFTQNGYNIPLDFGREAPKAEAVKRPQEPVKPYPYYEEEVTIKNDKAGLTLAGTLTLPKQGGSNYPAVILITGSGAQNRDEELLDHKPFLVLADYLTRQGIAVLRYDDRGTGKSTGKFANATTQDFATDAEAAFKYLKTRKEINPKKIGLAGHSEGGIVAPIVAVNNPDVDFIVLLAGTAIPGDELMVLQNYMIGKANGMPETELTKLSAINRNIYNLIKEEENITVLKTRLQAAFNKDLKPILVANGIPEHQVTSYIEMQVSDITSPWYVNFIRYNPAPTLEKVKCPVLAINGSKDVQVSAKANLDAIKRIAEKSGNKKITTVELEGLNHLFQTSTTGAPTEYGEIEETFAPAALKTVGDWIQQQVK